jgi:hypothetical protein
MFLKSGDALWVLMQEETGELKFALGLTKPLKSIQPQIDADERR